jgi:hypothetical protein
MPRPIYRWKSFWIGILVLGFIGWAWVRSMTWDENISGRSFGWVWEVFQDPGQFWMGCCADPFLLRTVGFYSLERDPEMRTWFQPAYHRATSPYSSQFYYFGFAHWYLILLFLIPWSGWLFFHWKREQKKLTT